MDVSELTFDWRGPVTNEEMGGLYTDAFGHDVHKSDWEEQLQRHSLG